MTNKIYPRDYKHKRFFRCTDEEWAIIQAAVPQGNRSEFIRQTLIDAARATGATVLFAGSYAKTDIDSFSAARTIHSNDPPQHDEDEMMP